MGNLKSNKTKEEWDDLVDSVKVTLNQIPMKNLHVLPTNKPTGIFKSGNNLLFSIMNKVRTIHEGFHIYITSSEQIKDGDWFYNPFINEIQINCNSDGCKKIILTTDIDLIADGVQTIDDEFLQWFVKNPKCEMVGVTLKDGGCLEKAITVPNSFYKIIIPNLEVWKEEPKQETIEQAAERLFPNKMEEYDIFLMGAKWQQEQDAKDIQLLSEEIGYLKRNKI